MGSGSTHGLKVLLCDGQLYQENYNTGTVRRTKGLVNRCLVQKYEPYGTLLLVRYTDQNFLFNLTQGLLAKTSFELLELLLETQT